MTNITNSYHCNPQHITIQEQKKALVNKRENDLVTASIVDINIIWGTFFFDYCLLGLGQLSQGKELIFSDCPDYVNPEYVYLHFCNLKKRYNSEPLF